MDINEPLHPSVVIALWMKDWNIGVRRLAEAMAISPSAITRLLRGERKVSAELAIRLAVVMGETPEHWMSLQNRYDLYFANKVINREVLTVLYTDETKSSKVVRLNRELDKGSS